VNRSRLRALALAPVSPEARCLAVLLASYGSGTTVDQATLARDMGVSDRAVRYRLRELLDIGLIRQARRGRLVETTVTPEAQLPGRPESVLPPSDGRVDAGTSASARASDFGTATTTEPSLRSGTTADAVVQEEEPSTRLWEEQSLGANESAAARAHARARPRDLLFEAVCEVCGIDWHELTERGPINAAVRKLKAVGATPGEVHVRAQNYRRTFDHAALTPPALCKHWPQLREAQRTGKATHADYMALAAKLREEGR